MKQIIRTTLDGLPVKAWVQIVPCIGRYLNTVYHTAKGASPAEILTGWKPQGYLPYAKAADTALQDHVFASREELWERVSAAAQRAEQSMEKRYNQL